MSAQVIPQPAPGLGGAKVELIRRGMPNGWITAATLDQMEFPELQEVVPGVLVEGLSIIAAPPKMGKSYAALDMALAVASGGKAFGAIQCERGDVLYLALEDGHRRLQARMRQLLPYDLQKPERLTLGITADRVGGGLEGQVEEWADSVDRPRLVIIDTWRAVKPEAAGRGSAYDEDAAGIAPLHELTKAHPGLCLLIVHHTRKLSDEDSFATISGTYGLTGVADSLLVLARHGDGHKLCIRGRDIEDAEKALVRDKLTGGWRMTGDARELAKTNERQEILDVLAEAGDEVLRTSQIATEIGKKPDATSYLLKKLHEEGLVKRIATGKWQLPNTPSMSTKPSMLRANIEGCPSDIVGIEGFVGGADDD